MPAAFQRNRVVREALVFLAFCAFTAALTWPYVLYLRDAVADTGDPYLVSWIMWWDYHQTFTDPLHLFHANIFYPLRYTLAFSENSYGIALPFFPLYALGFRPLTVHAIALFVGFASSGYGAFRLARTLTGSAGAGYLRRNPEDPPDGNLNGFNFWVKEVETTGEIGRLPRAFMESIEYREGKNKRGP